LEGFQDRPGEMPKGAGRREHCSGKEYPGPRLGAQGPVRAASPSPGPMRFASAISISNCWALSLKGPGLISAHTDLASSPCPEGLCPPGPECLPASTEGLALVVSEAPSVLEPAACQVTRPLALNSTSFQPRPGLSTLRAQAVPVPTPTLAVAGAPEQRGGGEDRVREFSHPSLPRPSRRPSPRLLGFQPPTSAARAHPGESTLFPPTPLPGRRRKEERRRSGLYS